MKSRCDKAKGFVLNVVDQSLQMPEICYLLPKPRLLVDHDLITTCIPRNKLNPNLLHDNLLTPFASSISASSAMFLSAHQPMYLPCLFCFQLSVRLLTCFQKIVSTDVSTKNASPDSEQLSSAHCRCFYRQPT